MAKRTTKAVGYVRVSTGKQDLSLEAQEERLQAYCKHAGLDLVEIIKERAVSGKVKLAKRPEGSRIAKLTAAGVHHVVCLKLDRLFRSAVDALTVVEAWDESGIALHLVDMGGQSINTGSSMGKMMLTMLAGFAEFERNAISDRTTAAISHLRKHGSVYNHVPYGFRADGDTLVEDRSEQAVIADMREWKRSGLSYNRIAAHMNARGIPSKTGAAWAAQTVYGILNRAA